MQRPLVAITLGDPAGIGPEIVAKAYSDEAVHKLCRPLAIGHAEFLRRAVKLTGSGAQVVEVESPEAAEPATDRIPCLQACQYDSLAVVPATIDPRAGQAAYDALLTATRLALAGEVDAVVTAPLCKASLARAGHQEPGHTEILARLCGVDDFAMMLYLAPGKPLLGKHGLAAVHVTLHNSIADVPRRLSTERVLVTIRLAARAIEPLAGGAARVVVCALNPHAGEEGLFGDEERRVIAPAVAAAQAEGIEVVGPLPADTAMVRARDGEFDTVVAMYHDQGHIALKLLGMDRAVNITLGLPIVRTSVAHGTAFDLAWQGQARADSMIEAIRVAARLSEHRAREKTTHVVAG